MPHGKTKMERDKDDEIDRLTKRVGELKAALIKYGSHGDKGSMIMCQQSKHSAYPCTCGFESALKESDSNDS